MEVALAYYPKLEPPPPGINTSTQLLGVVHDRAEIHDEDKKSAPAAEKGILLGDLPMEFQLDEVRVDGFGSSQRRWDWDDLFMEMDLWSSSW